MKESVILYNPEKEAKDKHHYAEEVLQGLKSQRKYIPMKFIYDEEGSKLCTSIDQSEKYYIWRCDKEVLESRGKQILQLMGTEKFNLIDLGAGDAMKTQSLLQLSQRQGYELKYIPIDISHFSIVDIESRFEKKFPKMQMTFLTSQFQEGIDWVQKNQEGKNMYIFGGSTFGNQTIEENIQFCQMLHSKLDDQDVFLLGIDLWKNPDIISRAYSDNGFESDFLMNNIKRINKELNSNFDLSKFYGFSYFDPFTHNIIGVITSAAEQIINICDENIKFKKGEVIETMRSRKWIVEDLVNLWGSAGFKSIGIFLDKQNYYAYAAFQKK